MDINSIEHELEEKILSLCSKIKNGQSTREFIEICYPGYKNGDGYGLFMFNLSVSILDSGVDAVVINPAGKSDDHNTFVHIFLFKDKDDRNKFKDEVLKLHMELDEKVIQIFRGEV